MQCMANRHSKFQLSVWIAAEFQSRGPAGWNRLVTKWDIIFGSASKYGCDLTVIWMVTVPGKLGQSSTFIYSLFPTWYTVCPSAYNNCYPLSSTCFRPHRPIIRRSKLYMQPMAFSTSGDVFVVRPLRKESFLHGRTTKTSAEGENAIGCMYNLDLLMMGLWGLKHVEERG